MSDLTLDPSSPPPILPSLPSTQAAFTKKYTDPSLQSALSSLHPSVRQSLINYDLSRVQRGQQPLSSQQTLAALQTVTNNAPATPPESQGFFARTLGDLSSLVSEVPHIPITLFHEAQQLPNAPGKLSEVLGRGSPQDIVAGLGEVPGLRLVPGVYTASQLAANGPGGLLEHPLFTALDIAPYAAPALKALAESSLSKLPSVEAARASTDISAINEQRASVGLPPQSDPSALRLLARQSPTVQSLVSSRPISALRTAFGSTARDLTQMYQATVGRVLHQSNPDALPIFLTPETAPLRAALTDAREWSSLIPPTRMQELTRGLEQDRTTLLADPTLSDTERAFIQQQADHVDAMADFAVQRDWLQRVDGETFTPPEARRILNSRRQVAKAEALTNARSQVLNGPDVAVSPSTLDTTSMLSEHLNRSDSLTLANAYAHALDASGYDATPLFDMVKGAKKLSAEDLPISDFHAAFTRQLSDLPQSPRVSQQSMIDQLRPFARTDPSVARVLDHIRRGDYQTAARTFHDTLGTRTVHVIPGSDNLLNTLQRGRETQKFLNQTSIYSDRLVSRLKAQNLVTEQRTVPARFTPIIEENVKGQLRDMYSSDPQALGLIEQGFYSLVKDLDPRELNRLQSDVARTWQDLRAQGYDPTFIHRVSPNRLPSLTRPNISDTIRTPTQVRARTLDATPYIPDAAVALTDQAMEYLSRLGQEEFTSNVLSLHGTTMPELVDRYYDAAVRANERDPSLSAAAHAQSLIQRDWTKYDPASIFPESQAKLHTFSSTTDQYIPKTVADTLTQLFHDKDYKLSAAFDPIMKVFKTSILPLSPRWHVNNIFGGATLLSMSTDPSIFFRYFSQARDLVNSGDLHVIEGMPPAGFGSVPAEIINWNKRSSLADKAVAGYNYKGGQFLRKIWEQSAPARDKANSIIDNSYKFNGFVDDLYRSMAYLYGHDKALTKGMTAIQAEQAGVALVRKILPEWDRITPFERQVMRFVFPFYTWCVGEDTEAFTKRGWVTGLDLRVDDQILSMIPESGEMRWSSIKSIYRNPNYDGLMHHLKSQVMDALVTPGHSFACADGVLRKVEDLRTRFGIRIMGRAVDGPTIFDDAFVETVGWAVTEGHYKRNKSGNITTIEISQKDGTECVDYIRSGLKEAGAQWHEFLAGVDRQIRYFGVTGEVAKAILEVAPNRVMTMEFLTSLSPHQRLILIDVMMAADGSQCQSRDRGDAEVFTQKSYEAANAFVSLCTMAGHPTYLRQLRGQWVVTIRSNSVARVQSLTRTQEHYKGLVWCPETEYGTFVCRRNGIVHVTGNTQFITKHAFTYPVDHPYRTAVTASLSRNELEDFGGGALPYKFMDTIFLGNPDDQGNLTALNTSAINPFRDVANYFTLAGFTRSANPVISTVLESLGINPAQGAQDLYPDIAYDPTTGQLRPSNPSLLSSFVGNILPQSQLITALIGQNTQYKQLLRTNPEAAATMLRSSVGLPNLFRTVNPSTESFKAETQRSTLQAQVKSEALRTGDWSRAESFPQLRAYFQQLSLLMGKSPELFKPYTPTQVQPAPDASLLSALRGVAP